MSKIATDLEAYNVGRLNPSSIVTNRCCTLLRAVTFGCRHIGYDYNRLVPLDLLQDASATSNFYGISPTASYTLYKSYVNIDGTKYYITGLAGTCQWLNSTTDAVIYSLRICSFKSFYGSDLASVLRINTTTDTTNPSNNLCLQVNKTAIEIDEEYPITETSTAGNVTGYHIRAKLLGSLHTDYLLVFNLTGEDDERVTINRSASNYYVYCNVPGLYLVKHSYNGTVVQSKVVTCLACTRNIFSWDGEMSYVAGHVYTVEKA